MKSRKDYPQTGDGQRAYNHDKDLDTCIHFNGTINDACEAGVNYKSQQAGDEYLFKSLPCWKSNNCNTCDKAQFPTEQEVKEKEGQLLERIKNLGIARIAIIEHLGDRKHGSGHLPCPVCSTGELHYSRAAYNGHIHASCTTTKCVSWME